MEKSEFQIIENYLKQIIDKLNSLPTENGVKDILDSTDMRGLLNVSDAWLWRERKHGRLKWFKIKGKIFYRLENVIAFLNENQNIKNE